MDPEGQKKSRRSAWDLVEAILDALPVQGLKSKTQIAREIGSKTETVEDYLELIIHIQDQETVERVKVGPGRYGYRRARAKRKGSR